MSSNAYYAELQPDPVLRRLVWWSGACLGGAGVFACAYLPLPAAARVAAALAWGAGSLRELTHLRRAWAGCLALRVRADGAAAVRGIDGAWQPAALLDGGILLRRAGWLRLRAGPGRVWAEPVRGACRNSHDWRRLQVIWRHVGAADRSC